MSNGNLPIIVGVGEICENVPDDLKNAGSIVDLGANAARKACEDALSVSVIARRIDAIAAVRTFSDSNLDYGKPFGEVKNLSRAIGKRLDCIPKYAMYDAPSGASPQSMVTEFSNRVASGEFDIVLLVGAEDIANAMAAVKNNVCVNRSDDVEGQLDDRGCISPGIITSQELSNNLNKAIPHYGLIENARRNNLKLSRQEYMQEIGTMLSKYSRIAAGNQCSVCPQALTIDEIITSGYNNPQMTDLYTKAMIAKDRVNQAAAIIITSEKKALELGISASKWVYLHGSCTIRDRVLLERKNAGKSPASDIAYQTALNRAGIVQNDINYFDIYSCFPIAVFTACEALGIQPDDDRGLTVTGGLPFFGGAGNSYSMFGIIGIIRKLRNNTSAYGLVGANGRYLSKISVGVYSSRRPQQDWIQYSDQSLQAQVDCIPASEILDYPEGEATITSFVVTMKDEKPERAFIIGKMVETGGVFIAASDPKDVATPRQMMAKDPFGEKVFVTSSGPGNRFTFSKQATMGLILPKKNFFRDQYKYCKVQTKDHLLEVTIDRPEIKNALNPYANEELSEIFDNYFTDPKLWVAILTGAGDDAFCAGNDLKFSNSGEKVWVPVKGFAGLTHRRYRNKPVIAAVNGFAMGGGMEIALACDLIVASENSVFALPEVRVGMIAGAGGINRLTRQIPLKIAMEMILTGKRISAKEAEELGLVNRVVPNGQALQAAHMLARELLEASPLSISCSLEFLQEGIEHADPATALLNHSKAIDRLLTSEDHKEGVRAFAEKRKPNWTGR